MYLRHSKDVVPSTRVRRLWWELTGYAKGRKWIKRDQQGSKRDARGSQIGANWVLNGSQRVPNRVHFLPLASPAVAGPQFGCAEHQR